VSVTGRTGCRIDVSVSDGGLVVRSASR